MQVIIFGATGMVGQGVSRECLLDQRIDAVVTIGRTVTGFSNIKLQEIRHDNMLDFGPVEAQLAGFDACFFCLGVSSAGMQEAEYARLTYDVTLAAAAILWGIITLT